MLLTYLSSTTVDGYVKTSDRVISAMSREAQVYLSYANFVKRSLQIAGLWPATARRYAAYTCLSIWSLSSLFIQWTATVYGFTKVLTNIGAFTLLLGSFASMLAIVVKGSFLFAYRKKVHLLNDILDPMLDEILKEPRYHSVAFHWVNRFYRLVFIEGILIAVISSLHALKSLLIRVLDNNTGNETRTYYPMPLNGFYPWSLDSPLRWYLNYLFEVNVCYFVFFVSAGVDAFFGFSMFRMSAVLRVLGVQFKALSRQKKNDENHRKMFVECVEKHNSLFRCRDIVEEVYGPTILVITMLNAICICSLIFQMIQVNGLHSKRAGFFVIFVTTKFTQTFIYAWPGCQVIIESEFLRNKAYCSTWYQNDDTNFTKYFTMILMQRPMVVRACYILEVSMDLFAKVTNTSISYYFLLRTLDVDE